MTNGPASYRDRIPGHVADDAVVRLRLTGSLSKFPVQDHPEVLAAKGDAGFVVLEGPAGSVRRAAAAFRRQDATPVTTPLADPDRNTFPYSFQSMIVAFVIAIVVIVAVAPLVIIFIAVIIVPNQTDISKMCGYGQQGHIGFSGTGWGAD